LRVRFLPAGGVAGAGSPRNGNRAVPSSSGSGDVLEALGFALELEPERIAQSIDELGFGFIFAPAHHPGFRHAAPVRKELGVRTVFNVLGPLTNPARAQAQIVGVYSAELAPVIAEALCRLGPRRPQGSHARLHPAQRRARRREAW